MALQENYWTYMIGPDQGGAYAVHCDRPVCVAAHGVTELTAAAPLPEASRVARAHVQQQHAGDPSCLQYGRSART